MAQASFAEPAFFCVHAERHQFTRIINVGGKPTGVTVDSFNHPAAFFPFQSAVNMLFAIYVSYGKCHMFQPLSTTIGTDAPNMLLHVVEFFSIGIIAFADSFCLSVKFVGILTE